MTQTEVAEIGDGNKTFEIKCEGCEFKSCPIQLHFSFFVIDHILTNLINELCKRLTNKNNFMTS